MKQLIIFSFVLFPFISFTQNKNILPGAYQTSEYFKLLEGKRIGLFANHTSTIEKTHLLDTLFKSNLKVTKVFAPEHGFRGIADAGEKVNNGIDAATEVQIISLYGKKLKPSKSDLVDVDVLVFDIQDVGVRFYTYISSLQYFIETAIENNLPIIVLDRPNPNGFYVDGPILEKEFSSFVGMQSIPIVYGMTIGEYAKMLIGEQMLEWKNVKAIDNRISLGELLGFEKEKSNFSLTVIPCKNYDHSDKYILPIPPSPNLPNMQSVYWYPSTCLFEGTVLSEGRGTDYPFCNFGHPSLDKKLFSFIPLSRIGAKEPKFKNEICYGWNVFEDDIEVLLRTINNQINLNYLINAYTLFEQKKSFFIKPKSELSTDYFFNKLAGNKTLLNQLINNKTEQEIRKSWKEKLNAFKKNRKKYLLYKDF